MWFANSFWTVNPRYRLTVLKVLIKFTYFINLYKGNIRIVLHKANIRIVLHKANNDTLHENILFSLPVLKFCHACIVTIGLSI
jgi:hypothetical protein